MSTVRRLPVDFTYPNNPTWPVHGCWEIIARLPFNMTPSPSALHQEVASELDLQTT